MRRLGFAVLLTLLAFSGCQSTDETPTAPSHTGMRLSVPVVVGGYSASSPTPAPTASPSPDPSPTATPTPVPTPEPSPSATPPPDCPGLGVTLGARCAGATPDCGITDPKNPVVEPDSKAVIDASYFIDAPWNKVHEGDACYPGPIEVWDTPGGLKCRPPFANGHAITCGPFPKSGRFEFRACGAGLCGHLTVRPK
jgi:hypothetical protein